MFQDKITVIIPVYNTEKYLERCLNGIVDQTYRNLEILLIDDGSTDSSGDICRSFAEKDDRITVLKKENGGQASARNLGLDRMTGKYVAFVDSDDYVNPDYIELLYCQIKGDQGIGIAACDYETVWELEEKKDTNRNSGKVVSNIKPELAGRVKAETEIEIYSAEEALDLLLYQKKFTQSPWSKLFKSEVFEEIRFPVGVGYEDLAIIYRTFDKAGKISYGKQKSYYYVQRAGSTMRSAFDHKKMDRLLISKEILAFVKNKYPKIEKAARARLFLSALQLLMNLPGSRKDHRLYEKEYEEVFAVIRCYRQGVLRDRKVKNSLRIMAACSYLGMPILKILGNLYNRLVNRAS